MRPAFTTTREAATFAVVLLLVLSLPLILEGKWLPSRDQSYAAYGWGMVPFPWVQHEIFDETNDIDIAFVGSSHIALGINTPYVQAQLSRKLGRPAVVRSVAWAGAGADTYYFVTKDLLAHRKVRLLVFFDDCGFDPVDRNAQAPTWFRLGDNLRDLDGLPWSEKVPYYMAAVIGSPKNLLALIRTNQPADLTATTYPNTLNLAGQLGAYTVRSSLVDSPFTNYQPATGVRPADVSIYSPDTQDRFHFSGAPLLPWEGFFQKKFLTLAQSHGCHLVLLHIPTSWEMNAARIEENHPWPGVDIVGISTRQLLADPDQNAWRKLFCDGKHLNQNGQIYFTTLVTPALLKLYDTSNHP